MLLGFQGVVHEQFDEDFEQKHTKIDVDNMLKPSNYFFTGRSKVVLLLLILLIMVQDCLYYTV